MAEPRAKLLIVDDEFNTREALIRFLGKKFDVTGAENGSAAIAPYYAGDFFTMYEDNEDLAFFYPKEGTNVFVDAMCIPASSQNPEIAERYIDFMLSEEAAIANAEYICYATPNTAVLENEDYSLKDNKYLYPENYDEVVSNASYYQDLPAEIKSYYGDLWTEIKGGG